MKRCLYLFLIGFYFTSSFGQAPGGHAGNLVFWLKADAGTNSTTDGASITSWSDQSGNGHNATNTGNAPTFSKVADGYYPAIDFSAVNGGLTLANDPSINTSPSSLKTLVVAFKTGADVTTRQLIYEEGGGGNGLNLYINSSNLFSNLWVGSADNAGSVPISANTSYVVIFVYDGVNLRLDTYVNGALGMSDVTAPASLPSHSGAVGIGVIQNATQYNGGQDVSSGDPFLGQIMEMSYYNGEALDATKRDNIFSYLGLKYDIPIAHNYYSAAPGEVWFWDYAGNAGYNDGISGIGRDDAGTLNKKQARSSATDGLITVGLGSVASDNASNANVFPTDAGFLLWGNNNGSLNWTTTGAPAGTAILGRGWKIQETGSIGNFRVQVPDNTSTLGTTLPPDQSGVFILADFDGNFSAGAVGVPLSLIGTNWELSAASSPYRYFTFATLSLTAALSVTTQGSEAGPVAIVYTVTLSGPNLTGEDITFDIDDLGTGTATSGSDYTAIPGSATITVEPGATTGTYAVQVANDAMVEAGETVIAEISNPSNGLVTISTATASANITDNDPTGPGGQYTNLTFWLRGDVGTNTTTDGASVTDWADHTPNAHNAVDRLTAPNYISSLSNFNPGIDFTSVNGGFTIADHTDINLSVSSAKSFTLAFKTGSDVTTRQLIYEQGGGANGINAYILAGELWMNLWTSNNDNAASIPVNPNTDYIISFVYDGASSRWDAYLNGSLAMSDVSVPASLPGHSGDIGIGVIVNSTQFDGKIDVTAGEPYSGHIMEQAYFHALVWNSAQREQIESYLALKYGQTLTHDYIASNGTTTFWNIAANSGYNNSIAGIGRDDLSDLYQRQSFSTESGSLVRMGLGTIEANNQANEINLGTNHSFLMAGHNGGTATFTTTAAPSGRNVLDRKWKVQETGTVGTIKIQIPASTSAETAKLPEVATLDILTDADGNFSSGATVTAMTLNGTNWEADIDLANGQYFTFSQPGIVLSTTTNGVETGPVDIVYTATLPGINNSGSPITLDVTDLGTGTAASGADYSAIPGGATISIANGSQTGTYTVTVIDDLTDETIEDVKISISNPSSAAYWISTSEATATITSDDNASPGGVSANLNVWLRADMGTSSTTDNTLLTTWTDQSGNGNDGTSDGTPPTFKNNPANNFNFNPTLDFDGLDDRLVVDLSSIKSGAGDGDYSLFAVGARDNGNFNIVLGSQGGTANQDLHFGYRNTSQLTIAQWANDMDLAVSNFDNPAITPYLISAVYNSSTRILEEMRDGNFGRVSGANSIDLGGIKTNFIGDLQSLGNYDGRITEVIVFNNDLSDINKLQVYTYFAIKYGLLLPSDNDNDAVLNEIISGSVREGDYLGSDGSTVIWDYAAQGAAYYNDVAGIGRDDRSNLFQKQSKSASQSSLLTIGLGAIAPTNDANANNFSVDMSYLVWGHNNGNLTGVADNSGLGAQSGIVDIWERKWQLVETGTVGSVQIAFHKATIDTAFTYESYGNIYARVADDEAFTTNVVDVLLTPATINGTASYVGDHDFNGTKFLTIIQKDIVLWTGTEWRGGMSSATAHAPVEGSLDTLKAMYILADTAVLNEAAHLNSVDIDSGSVLLVTPGNCLKTISINNSGVFLLKADTTGFSQYKGPAVAATFEQYVANEGWHYIGSPFSDVTWSDLTFKDDNGFINHPQGGGSLDSCNYCNLWWYDGTTDNGADIGFAGSSAYGTWRSSSDTSEAFDASKGWNLYLDASQNFGSAPWTISFSGTLNAGNISQTVNENNSGWNLVANPFPAAIDWDKVDDDIAAGGIASAYHIWDETNTNFATYSAGAGTLGANQYIAPMQGFFVQTAVAGGQNSGDVFHSFDLTPGDLPSDCEGGTGIFFKTTGSGDKIVLRTTNHNSGKFDETIIRFSESASREFYSEEDIRKLFTTYSDVPSLYSRFESDFSSIAAVPYPDARDSVELGIHTDDKKLVSIELLDYPRDLYIYLEDIKTGDWYKLDKPHQFTTDKSFRERFVLHYSRQALSLKKGSENPFNIHIEKDQLVIITEKRVREGEWYLTNMAGAVVKQGTINSQNGLRHTAGIGGLSAGVYVFVLHTNDQKYTEKLPVINLQ